MLPSLPPRLGSTPLLAWALLLILTGLASCKNNRLPTQDKAAIEQSPTTPRTSGAPGEPLASTVIPALSKTPQPSPPHTWSGRGCTRIGCHNAIEPIRAPDSGMMKAIFERGAQVDEPDGCTVCHGGTPNAPTADLAHQGAMIELQDFDGPTQFFADPASPWVNPQSCGQCHPKLVAAQYNSLMMTEAGKIQGTTWSFGAAAGKSYEHRWANYPTKNPEDPEARIGTPAYKAYMQHKTKMHPQVFVQAHEGLPEAPTLEDLSKLKDAPEQAVFTYIRTECQRCHLGVKGRPKRGDFRGMGCGACHMPYGNEGIYEGKDTTLGPHGPGRPLVHQIQGTRDAVVTVHGKAYSGIPVETCTTCHNRGKRIGVSYQGLMESAFGSPFTEGGGGQLALHSKHYLALQKDVHYQAGMLCQDCHTSGDVHGDGFLAAANLGPIEVECSDCHGTPKFYPWELPLGYGDEDGVGHRATGKARGVAPTLDPALGHLKKGYVAQPQDGYLLSARGNPMPEIVKDGNIVQIHTASGKTLRLEPLKKRYEEGKLSASATAAMVHAEKHMETMECYACHASWAPQCYGCHVKIDYSENKQSLDWVKAGRKHLLPAHRTDPGESGYDASIPGHVQELRSYMRWEDPVLGVNGEGRVTPLIPGCQVSATIIGAKGEEILRNHVFKTPAGTEGGDVHGQLGIDMSPVQPHTIGKSRSCESCHGSDKAAGYGIGPKLDAPWSQSKIVDLATADGQILPKSARPQIEPVHNLTQDWSAVVTRDGKQLQTVGHHFKDSGPLSLEQRRSLERQNVCVGCHIEIPQGDLAVSIAVHIGQMTGQTPQGRTQHALLLNKILKWSAWAQLVLGATFGGLLVLAIGYYRRRRRRSHQ